MDKRIQEIILGDMAKLKNYIQEFDNEETTYMDKTKTLLNIKLQSRILLDRFETVFGDNLKEIFKTKE
jgi:hypothetical protein